MSKFKINMELKDFIERDPEDRIYVFVVDGRTKKVITDVSVMSEYYDDKRADVIEVACKRAYQETLLHLQS